MPPKKATARRRKNSGDEEFKLSKSEESDSSSSSSAKSVVSSGRRSPGRRSPGRKRTSVGGDSSSRASPGRKTNKTNTSQGPARKKTTRRKTRRQNTIVTSKTRHRNETGEEDGSNVLGEIKQKVVPKIVVRNPTKKFVVIPKKQNFNDGYLTPPKPRRNKSSRSKQQKGQKSPLKKDRDKENDHAFEEDIALLSKLPLPSTSHRTRFDRNISIIGAMNIQAFGAKKASNSVLMRIITDILRRYDIVLCQEIHAPKDDESIIQKLCQEVSTPNTPYAYVTSPPIGRNRYQERYVYLYRENEWKVLNNYVIDDDIAMGDKFAREPFVVRFQHLRKPDVRISLVGCHTQPEKAFDEISTLVEQVYDQVKDRIKPSKRMSERIGAVSTRDVGNDDDGERSLVQILKSILCPCLPSYTSVATRDFQDAPATTSGRNSLTVSSVTTEPIVMMGDFNAAGSYVNKSKRAELDAILKKHDLVWGISNIADTTVSDGTDSAYDRFIFEAANERTWIKNSGVWRYDDGWLAGKDDTKLIKRASKRISDHYPIEFELRLS